MHRRHRLGDRPHLRRLRTARLRGDADGVRGRADVSRCRTLLEDDPGSQDQHLHTAPTAIRSLIKAADTNPEVAPTKYDLSSLRLLGTVGEPINPEAWMWYYEKVGGGRCPIVDTFWQTETGGHMITPPARRDAAGAGFVHLLPFPGIQATIVDETGTEPTGAKGRAARRDEAVAVDDPHHLGRPRPLQALLLPGRLRASSASPATARCATCRPATSRSPAASTTC